MGIEEIKRNAPEGSTHYATDGILFTYLRRGKKGWCFYSKIRNNWNGWNNYFGLVIKPLNNEELRDEYF